MAPYTKGFLITLLGVIIISPDTLLIRLIDADTFAQLFWRGTLSGGAVLAGFWAITGRTFPRAILSMGGPGIWATLIFAAGTICFVYSVTNTSVANTLFITSTSPVFAALIARFVLGEHVSLRTWLTIAATLAGIVVIASGSLTGSAGNLAGDLAALGGAVSLAATFSIARAKKAVSMVPAMGMAGIVSALIAIPIAPSLHIPPEDYLWLGLLGLLVVPLGFALLATGPRYLPAPDVSLLLLLEAIFGPLLVWLVLAENPGLRTLVGGGIILGAMVLNNLTGLRQAHATSRLK